MLPSQPSLPSAAPEKHLIQYRENLFQRFSNTANTKHDSRSSSRGAHASFSSKEPALLTLETPRRSRKKTYAIDLPCVGIIAALNLRLQLGQIRSGNLPWRRGARASSWPSG